MNNRKNLEDISKEFNNQLVSTGHFGTFQKKTLTNDNHYLIIDDENKSSIRTKYDKIFSQTNPKNLNSNNENLNLSLENMAFFPNYYLELEEALKKSNNNVQELKEALKKANSNVHELKETIRQKINEEKNMKIRIENLKIENNKLSEINEQLRAKLNQCENNFKNVNGLLQKINDIGDDIQEANTLNKHLKKTQEENLKLIYINKKLSEENFKYMNEIKKLKTDIKNHLYEKIKFLKMNNINKEQKILNNKLNNIINDNKIQIRSLSKENTKLKDIQKEYQYLSTNYKKISDDNTLYKEKMRKKENIEKNFEELREKFDREKFEFLCQINIWKNTFLSIAKYKLLNYNPNYDQNIVNVMKIDQNYINNSPKSFKLFPEKILKYFKELIEREANNMKVDKSNSKGMEEIEDNIYKIDSLNNQLIEQKKLRRKIFFKYLNLRGNVSIMCNLRPFNQDDNNEIITNKSSQIDTFIINKNNIIIKNNKINNNIKKYEFDYVFSGKDSHQDIYEEIFPLIHSIFKGNNIIMLSYEEKRIDKSFKILGDDNNIGILGRAIQEIFYILNDSNKDKYNNFEISFNVLCILNNELYNLLDESTPIIHLNEENNDMKKKLINLNLISEKIKSYEEYNKLMKLSKQLLNNSKNIDKNNSSINFIYSFNIELKEKEGKSIQSTLTFIDYGSEKNILMSENKLSKSKDNNTEDIKDINKNEEENIKYDNNLFSFLSKVNKVNNENLIESKDFCKNILIDYLKNYVMNNNFKILLLLNISSDINDLDDTLKTLSLTEGIIQKNEEIILEMI